VGAVLILLDLGQLRIGCEQRLIEALVVLVAGDPTFVDVVGRSLAIVRI